MSDDDRLIHVWDRPVRILHWTLAIAVCAAWLSTLGFGCARLHEPAGYMAAAATLLRVAWGFAGSRDARFATFLLPPSQVVSYARDVWAGTEARYVGHNPLGGWMIAAMLSSVAGACFSGWLFTTDYFWGSTPIANAHSVLAWLVLALVTLHLCGVIFTSTRHRENLVLAMFTGRKRPVSSDQGDALSSDGRSQGTASRTGKQAQGS